MHNALMWYRKTFIHRDFQQDLASLTAHVDFGIGDNCSGFHIDYMVL